MSLNRRSNIFWRSKLPCSLLPLLRRLVKFNNVNKLSIFIEDNQGEEDVTRIQKLVLYGSGGQTMNMNEIKKVGEEQG